MTPRLETERLALRLFELADAPEVQRLAGAAEVARTTLSIPHPYPDGAAEAWIERTRQVYASGSIHAFAVEAKVPPLSRETGELAGCVSLRVNGAHRHAELAYWIGRPFWGRGYATEAARAVVRYGFGELKLNRIFAAAMTSNPASSRVMAKLGMKHEGTFSQHIWKDGSFADLVYYGVVQGEWEDGGALSVMR
ncbi:GNAT family N-acetyltransferase [Paenibacillus cymbidii]|uniref:GNAT family N-acetyltransferase n=1 Tax=Paenibacillus cymbidii TaxID=1639034 RepID=UPI00108092FF|nr:GNAT family N-acetyltransferase [Paenibacillus cymbidii]